MSSKRSPHNVIFVTSELFSSTAVHDNWSTDDCSVWLVGNLTPVDDCEVTAE